MRRSRVHAPLGPDVDDGVDDGRAGSDLVMLGNDRSCHHLRTTALGLLAERRQLAAPAAARPLATVGRGLQSFVDLVVLLDELIVDSSVNWPEAFHLSLHLGLAHAPSVDICDDT